MDAAPAADTVTLGFGFSFADLAGRDGLVRLDRIFLDRLAGDDAALHARLLAARAAPDALATPEESELVVALAPHLDGFVAALFGIEAETLALALRDPCARPDPRVQAAVRAAPGGEEVCRPVAVRRHRVARRSGSAVRRDAHRARVR